MSSSQRKGSRPRNKAAPTHFLAFRVASKEIYANVCAVQDTIRSRFPRLQQCLIAPETLHVTLFVLHLTPDHVPTAVRVLTDAVAEFWSRMEQTTAPVVKFQRIGTFNQAAEVLYVDACGETTTTVKELCDHLRVRFQQANLVDHQARQKFKPHLTVFKTSRARPMVLKLNRGRDKNDRIQSELYEYLQTHTNYTRMHFGEQAVDSIELLSMTGEKALDGYYKCLHSVRLT